jgi:hypothetical protein
MEDVEPVADRFRRALAEAKHTDHRSVLNARLLGWRDDLRVVREKLRSGDTPDAEASASKMADQNLGHKEAQKTQKEDHASRFLRVYASCVFGGNPRCVCRLGEIFVVHP